MSLLNTDAVIEIKLYYQEKKSNKYGYTFIKILEEEEEALDLISDYNKNKEECKKDLELPEEERKNIEKIEDPEVQILRTLWKDLTWSDQNNITEKASFYNEKEGMTDVNFCKFRDLRVKTCLVKWDLKDDNKKEIPLTPENINSLPNDVVLYLLRQYEKATSLTGDERKN